MVAPQDVIDAIVLSVARSGKLPPEISVLTAEADEESEDADVEMPLFEVELVESVRVHPNNTDLAGFIKDDSGNKVGRIYRTEYEMTLELDMWTSTDDGFDAYDLGQRVREALYPHSSYGDAEPLRDAEGNTVDEVFRFVISDGTRADDTITTPTVRRWRQEVEIWACEEFTTTEEPIRGFNFSTDFTDEDNDGLISNTSGE